MTYFVVAYKAVPRSKLPPRHFDVEDMTKRMKGARNGWAVVVGRKEDIPGAAEFVWLNQPLANPDNPSEFHAGWGEAAYVVRGCTAWLIWYKPPGQEGVWLSEN